MKTAVSHIAEDYRDGDLVVVAISTHGDKGGVSLKVGENGKDGVGISADGLRNLLSKFRRAPTIIIISACHSGSLIDSLAAPRRIAVTAAREDRKAYLVSKLAKNTDFVRLVAANMNPEHTSFRAVFDASFADLENEETFWGIVPSKPQIRIGAEMSAVLGEAVF